MKFLELVEEEINRSRAIHGNIHSAHEALGIIDEEFEEVRKEIHQRHLNKENLLKELVQLAAMCAKAADDIGCLTTYEV